MKVGFLWPSLLFRFRKEKKKNGFSFAFLSLIRNFAPNIINFNRKNTKFNEK